MIDSNKVLDAVKKKLDSMTEVERIEYLKEMGFEFNNPSTRRMVRIGRAVVRRGRQSKASPMVRASKKLIAKKTYTGLETVDKKTRKKPKKANT